MESDPDRNADQRARIIRALFDPELMRAAVERTRQLPNELVKRPLGFHPKEM